MSMNIVSRAMAGSAYFQGSGSVLSRELYNQLLLLGIDPNEISSVAEAKKAIAAAEQAKNEEKEQNHVGESKDLRDRTELLALKVGISVKDSDTVDDILENIESVLEHLSKTALEHGDEGLYNLVEKFKSELKGLQAENAGGGIANVVVYSFMDMVANQNKYALGLNKK